MNNTELFNYLCWSLQCVERSNTNYLNTGNKFWKSRLIQDILLYVGALKQAKKQIPEKAIWFPKFIVYKRGKQITIYTVYFDLVL